MKTPKVAIVHVGAPIWCAMSPQVQMTYAAQQLIQFMGSAYFQDFDGFCIRVSAESGAYEDVLVIGQEAATEKSGLITPSRGVIVPGPGFKS